MEAEHDIAADAGIKETEAVPSLNSEQKSLSKETGAIPAIQTDKIISNKPVVELQRDESRGMEFCAALSPSEKEAVDLLWEKYQEQSNNEGASMFIF